MSSYWNARECTEPEAFHGGTPDDEEVMPPLGTVAEATIAIAYNGNVVAVYAPTFFGAIHDQYDDPIEFGEIEKAPGVYRVTMELCVDTDNRWSHPVYYFKVLLLEKIL